MIATYDSMYGNNSPYHTSTIKTKYIVTRRNGTCYMYVCYNWGET